MAALFGVWSRLTGPSRRALRLAQERSIAGGGECVETEDVAVGLLAEPEGIAAVALTKFGLGTEEAIAHAKGQRRAREERAAGAMRFSRPVKMALERALQEAYFLGQHHADTEHVLLGLCERCACFPTVDSRSSLVSITNWDFAARSVDSSHRAIFETAPRTQPILEPQGVFSGRPQQRRPAVRT